MWYGPAVKWLWYTLLTLLTLLYYTYYGLLAVVLSPNLQVSSVASTLFYAIWCAPLVLASPGGRQQSLVSHLSESAGRMQEAVPDTLCGALQEPVQRLSDYTAPDPCECCSAVQSLHCYTPAPASQRCTG